jgi:hypothetical protein
VANSQWFEDAAGRHITAVAATLPLGVVAAAQEHGRARDLEATVRELLAELEAETQDEESTAEMRLGRQSPKQGRTDQVSTENASI